MRRTERRRGTNSEEVKRTARRVRQPGGERSGSGVKHGSIIQDGQSGLGKGRPGARPLKSSCWCSMRYSSTSRTENTPYQRCCKPVESALCPRTSVCRIVVCPHLARRGSSKFHMCCAMMLPLTDQAHTSHCALTSSWTGFNRTRSVLTNPPRHESDTWPAYSEPALGSEHMIATLRNVPAPDAVAPVVVLLYSSTTCCQKPTAPFRRMIFAELTKRTPLRWGVRLDGPWQRSTLDHSAPDSSQSASAKFSRCIRHSHRWGQWARNSTPAELMERAAPWYTMRTPVTF